MSFVQITSLRRTGHALAGALLLAATSAAQAQAPASAPADDAGVRELGRLIAHALPVDLVFKMQIDKDPAWPLLAKASRVPPEKLACARERLSPDGFIDSRTDDAREFAKQAPASVAGAIRVLKAGAADMTHAFFVAGGERKDKTKPLDEKEVIARFTPAQLAAFNELQGSSEHVVLRRLIGLPDPERKRVDEVLDRPGGDMRVALQRILLGSMSYCGISLADIR